MKTFAITLVASTLALGAFAPAMADEGNSRTYKQQMTDAWIATGDPIYGRLSGLTDAQIKKAAHLPVETNALD